MADLERAAAESGDMNDLIDHWVQVIDRWIQDIDRGMGGPAEGADPAEMLDSEPELGPTTTRAVDTG